MFHLWGVERRLLFVQSFLSDFTLMLPPLSQVLQQLSLLPLEGDRIWLSSSPHMTWRQKLSFHRRRSRMDLNWYKFTNYCRITSSHTDSVWHRWCWSTPGRLDLSVFDYFEPDLLIDWLTSDLPPLLGGVKFLLNSLQRGFMAGWSGRPQLGTAVKRGRLQNDFKGSSTRTLVQLDHLHVTNVAQVQVHHTYRDRKQHPEQPPAYNTRQSECTDRRKNGQTQEWTKWKNHPICNMSVINLYFLLVYQCPSLSLCAFVQSDHVHPSFLP